jgi:PAS domain S-box-containing protein
MSEAAVSRLPAATDGPAEAAAALSQPAQQMLNALTVAVYAHRGGRVLHANAAMLRLTGHTAESMAACAHGDVAAEAWRAALQRYGESGLHSASEQPAMELNLWHVQGADRPVEINARHLVLDGLPTVIVTCQDLSDIQLVQNSMLNLSQVLHQIIDGGPLATFVVNGERQVTHWNRACQLLTGKQAWEMLGRNDTWRAFFREERPLLVDLIVGKLPQQGFEALFEGGLQTSGHVPGAYQAEGFVSALGDSGRWLSFNAAPLRDAAGAIVGAVQTMQDVTERRQAEQELLRHRNELEKLVAERSAELSSTVDQLAAFMENSPVGVVHVVAGLVTHHNRVIAEMFGVEGDSLVGRRGAEFFADREVYAALIRDAVPCLAKGQSLQRDMWMRLGDGPDLWVQMIAYAADVADPGAGTWWLVQNRTAFRRAQDELQSNFQRIKEANQKLEDAQHQLLQQDKMASIGVLAAGVAHEINNPIGFVGSNLHTLKGYVRDLLGLIDTYQGTESQGMPEEALRAVAAMRAQVDIDYLREDLPNLLNESEDGLVRVKRIVQDLKDFSRVDQDDWQDADLNSGLESTLNVVMHEVKYKATIERRLQPLPRVRCLAAQLNQVFMNLIVNASHAIATSGVITLSSAHVEGAHGDWVWIEVADTGSGMSETVIKRIFEPFYTTKAVGSGTGLGLSLSFSIVQKHGGVIRVRSEPGQGSAFRVWVPVAGPQPDAPLTPPPPEPPWI